MTYLVFFIALALSAVAAYYSIIGLITIFAASVIPIAIMGSTLEVAKLVTASWLYQNWKTANILLKSYFIFAVIVLMLITSMGIFGFLSKAHIQQTSEAEQQQSVIVRINEQSLSIENRINAMQTSAIDNNEQVNTQVEANNVKIEQINSRYETLVEEQNTIIKEARRTLVTLEQYIAENDVRKIQALVGAKVDGQYGSGTAQKVEEFRAAETAKSGDVVTRARDRVTSLRDQQSQEISRIVESNSRLSEQIGVVRVDTTQLETLQAQLSKLEEQKFELETDYRKLEAEFGPIKYISEMIYGDDAKANLDDSVRIVILMLIFVFDPLAILLLIAANQGLKERQNDKPNRRVETVDTEQYAEMGSSIPDDTVSADDAGHSKMEQTEVQSNEIREVKVADVEVQYEEKTGEFNFVEYPTDVKDDRNYPQLRALKEKK